MRLSPEVMTIVFERFLERHDHADRRSLIRSMLLEDLDWFFEEGADYGAWVKAFTRSGVLNQFYTMIHAKEIEILDEDHDTFAQSILESYWQVFTDLVNTMTNPDRPFEEILDAVVQKRWEEIATLSSSGS